MTSLVQSISSHRNFRNTLAVFIHSLSVSFFVFLSSSIIFINKLIQPIFFPQTSLIYSLIHSFSSPFIVSLAGGWCHQLHCQINRFSSAKSVSIPLHMCSAVSYVLLYFSLFNYNSVVVRKAIRSKYQLNLRRHSGSTRLVAGRSSR